MYRSLACLMFKSRNRRKETSRSNSSPIKNPQEEKKEIYNVRRDDTDHISGLPNDILVQILTLLPTEEAVRTSFWSKRWKSLWTELPVLDLDFISFSKRLNKLCLDHRKHLFLEFLEYVLFHSEIKQFQKLRLGFDMAVFKVYTHRIRKLIRFATSGNCSELDLDFSYANEGFALKSVYSLPPCSFPSETLINLKLTECKFVSSRYANFMSLKIAIMMKVKLPKDSVYHLISNSPCLEELQLIQCCITPYLYLHHPKSKLKSLVLDWCYNSKDDDSWVEVNIPSLSQFKFGGNMPAHFSIINGKNLIEVELDLSVIEYEQMQLCDILKDLSHVKILTLCGWCLEVLSANGMIIMPRTFNNLRHLTVKLCSQNRELPSLSGILESAPYLETLSIHFDQSNEFEDDEISSLFNDKSTFWRPHLLPSYNVTHLKKVEIKGFYGGANEKELVKTMLKSSLSLEKIVTCKEEMKSRYEIVNHGDGNHLKVLQRQQEKAIENLLTFACGSRVTRAILE